MKKLILLFFVCFALTRVAYAGDTLRVLFIGNSYTAVNNLPGLISQLAEADSNTLIYDASMPGSATLQQHCSNSATLSLLHQHDWDYVVLQEQSQLPAFPDSQVAVDVYPYAKQLDSIVHVFSPCARTVFYMTWGRKNGDQSNCASFPPICSYDGMDSLLQLRYTNMADSFGALLCPVSPVWHFIRDFNPNMNLYQPDESHPTLTGSFLAACSFYALLFNADIQNNTYNSSLSPNDAAFIKSRTQMIVSDSLNYWKRFDMFPEVVSGFSYTSSGSDSSMLSFTNESENANDYSWDFGDGQSSTAENPTHIFAPGNYTVCLTAMNNCDSVISCQQVNVSPSGISEFSKEAAWLIYPNPVSDMMQVKNISGPTQFVICNYLGQKIKQGEIKPKSNYIKTSGLPEGFYFIRLKDNKGFSGTEKFRKIH